jgi:hypothetical protein
VCEISWWTGVNSQRVPSNSTNQSIAADAPLAVFRRIKVRRRNPTEPDHQSDGFCAKWRLLVSGRRATSRLANRPTEWRDRASRKPCRPPAGRAVCAPAALRRRVPRPHRDLIAGTLDLADRVLGGAALPHRMLVKRWQRGGPPADRRRRRVLDLSHMARPAAHPATTMSTALLIFAVQEMGAIGKPACTTVQSVNHCSREPVQDFAPAADPRAPHR